MLNSHTNSFIQVFPKHMAIPQFKIFQIHKTQMNVHNKLDNIAILTRIVNAEINIKMFLMKSQT